MFAERLLRAWHGTGVEGNKTGRFPLQEPRVLPAEGTENRPAGPGPGRMGNDPRSGAGPQGPPAEGRPEPCRRLPAGAGLSRHAGIGRYGHASRRRRGVPSAALTTPKPLKQTLSGGALNLQQPLPPAPGSAGTPALPGAAAASSAALGRTTPAPPPPTAGSCEGLGRWSLLGKPPRPPLVPVPLSLHFRLLCLTFYFEITSDVQKMCKDDTCSHVPFVQPPLLSAPYIVVELAKLSPVTRCHRRN